MTIEELKEQLAIIDKAAAVVKGLQVHMAEFIESMGRQRRKDFSHRGALPSRPGDPKHWQIQGAWSFDPGNLIYGRAFAIAFPALIEERSSENLGDILEAYFAYALEERWDYWKWSQDVQDVVYAVWDCRDDSSTEKLPWLRALRRRLYGNDVLEIDIADVANPWLAWQYENIPPRPPEIHARNQLGFFLWALGWTTPKLEHFVSNGPNFGVGAKKSTRFFPLGSGVDHPKVRALRFERP